MDAIEAATAMDPVSLFRAWMTEAEAREPNDPNAAALATATPEGAPSVRMVLLKGVDERGFAFYTNSESRKGVELAANPRAAMCFHWKSLRRQVRVEGAVSELPALEADVYFHSRSRGSQLGAAVSRQSQELESREALEEMVREYAARHEGEIPRPERWKGYVLWPERMEFWINGEERLHDRFLFVRGDGGWVKSRLFP
ncbi:MAG TPA: pyridoxamine 5'-phosphate oxidase [Edaphobacter sp.]|jgi:pyridoxamine 5'-phosphate oxidase|nr:pyridoxamine 5'-phosphate oxidase [Edaphobacter sp.]